MWRLARLSLMIWASGLPFTNVVSTFTGKPKYDEMLATFVSALETCSVKLVAWCTPCPNAGARRMPMLVGTTMAYLQLGLSSSFTGWSFRGRVMPEKNYQIPAADA